MIKQCDECGDPFEADEDWKTHCLACYLKKYKPDVFEKQYKIGAITCKRCGNVFIDELWKDLCFRCWLADQEESKQIELEEREQYK